jgi:hypothetical protein
VGTTDKLLRRETSTASRLQTRFHSLARLIQPAAMSFYTVWRCSRRLTARLSVGVCAVHAVMLGGESPPSRCTWSRRTREAPGRHREVGSEGSVERTCGARDTNRIRGVVQPGRAGTQQQSPPSTTGRCLINPASMHGRYDSLPREICGVSWYGTEGGGIPPDRPAEVSRRHSTTGNSGKARTVEESSCLRWSGEMASGEGSGYARPLG